MEDLKRVYQNLNAGQVFSGKPSSTMVWGWSAPGARTPRVQAGYIMPQWGRDLILWAIYGREPLYISGPTGCGKTAGVKQVAAKLNYEVYELTAHARLETPELVGHFALRDGSTVWVDGPLTAAMRSGAIFILNEIDLLDPSTATGLNSVLDGSALCIADTGEAVEPHPAFRFIGTANTNGSGDESGLYAGTLRQNAAFQNRFLHIEADYLDEKFERRLLRGAGPALPDDALDRMQKFIALVRAQSLGRTLDAEQIKAADGFASQLAHPISTRAAVRWAYWLEKLEARRGKEPIAETAYKLSIGNALDMAEREASLAVLRCVFGE